MIEIDESPEADPESVVALLRAKGFSQAGRRPPGELAANFLFPRGA